MRHFLLLALLISQSAFAKSWLAERCDRLLGLGSDVVPKPSVGMSEILRRLEAEVFRGNQFSRHRMAVTFEPVNGLSSGPAAPVVRPTLGAEFQWVRQPEIKLFVDPNRLDHAWEDEGADLGRTRGLMALVDNVSVTTSGGPRRLIDLLQEEARFVRERNPDLKFELRAEKVEGASNERFMVWAEGDIQNYQVLRLMIVTLQYAFDVLARDPAFVRVNSH